MCDNCRAERDGLAHLPPGTSVTLPCPVCGPRELKVSRWAIVGDVVAGALMAINYLVFTYLAFMVFAAVLLVFAIGVSQVVSK